MILDNLVNGTRRTHTKLSEKFDHLYYSSLACITTKVLDAISTSLCAHKYGIQGEKNDLTRYAMEELGIDAGLFVKNAALITFLIGAGYLINKLSNKCSENRIVRNIGSITLYGSALYFMPPVVNNLAQYFQ